MIPAKRSSSDTEPLRLSRSMTAEDPNHKSLLLDHRSPPSIPPSTRRRVNPEDLSVRLGRELVAELDSFVQPGVIEMPSFAVRQEIQTRYNVDRRHIYDWFHSKGLRVTKEDKRATLELKTDAMRLTRVRTTVQSAKARSRLRRSGPASLCSPALPIPPPTLSAPMTMIVEDYAVPLPCASTSADRLIVPANSTIVYSPRPPPGASRSLRDPYIHDICPIYENGPLDYAARKSYYDTLSRVIGPADGVQECVGTYGAYMAKQLKVYYDRILPSHAAIPSYLPTPGLSGLSGTLSASSGFIPSYRPSNTGHTGRSCDVPSTRDSETLFTVTSTNTLVLEDNVPTMGKDTSLDLCDIIASPVLQNYAPPQPQTRPPRAKTVSFALDDRALLNFSSLLVLPAKGSFFNHSSSSLAGALGECPSSGSFRTDQEARHSKDWNRPRMGRPRAYSGGGGI